MLLSFSVTNWMSFRDTTTLNMIATQERQHANHVTRLSSPDVRLLPVAAIYGGNASGKSNLIKALSFVSYFITNPPKPDGVIPIRPFRLEKSADSRPASFAVSFLAQDNCIYEYSFSVNTRQVLREELKRYTPSEKRIFLRQGESKNFDLSPEIDGTDRRQRQEFAFHGTQDNQLFLSNSVSQKLTEFKPVYDWFDRLRIVFPRSFFCNLMGITSEGHPLHDKFVTWMRNLDSGIASLQQKKIPPENAFPKGLLETISADLKEGETRDSLPWSPGVSLCKENGAVVGRRLTPMHRNAQGEEVPFDLSEESDGTQRLFDIVPAFLFLEENKKDAPHVFVIDELDRSLHTNLTIALLRNYLALERSGSLRAQLIFTTHDVNLMTQKLFRRDEIWFTERKEGGASSLVAISEFKDVRSDKDIRKHYLQGRMGGTPCIRNLHASCKEEE